jgi:hypothetical protein
MHVIRLRGPWEIVAAEAASKRVTIPCNPAEILGTGFNGQVRLIRPFNTPTNLEPHERVYLVMEALPTTAGLTMNGTPLPCPAGAEPARIDITGLLALHNRLEVTLKLPGGTLGEVRLEIG